MALTETGAITLNPEKGTLSHVPFRVRQTGDVILVPLRACQSLRVRSGS